MRSALGVIRYTTLEAIRKGTLIAYFIIGSLIILFFAFGLSVSAEDKNLITLFGSENFGRQAQQTGIDGANLLLSQLHNSAAFWITILGLFGTAGLIRSFLEKGTVDLLLSKPLSRSSLLFTRCAGALAGLAANYLFFVIGIWFVFGMKTGTWNWNFLLASLLMLFTYACLFSITVITALRTESTAMAILITLAVWGLSTLLSVREAAFPLWDNVVFHRTLDALYYIVPQIVGMSFNASKLIVSLPVPTEHFKFDTLPFVYSTLSAGGFYALSIWYFKRKDY